MSAAGNDDSGTGENRWTAWMGDRNRVLLAATVIAAIGVMMGGWFAASVLVRGKEAERAVTVRGVAERDVRADLATWTLSYSASAGDLTTAQSSAEADTASIIAYFRGLGFPAAALTPAGASVSSYTSEATFERPSRTTVTVSQRLQFRSTDIARAERAVSRQFDLVRRGVELSEGSAMRYSFTKLNDIKPAMIAAATRDARRAAEQFANDSGSGVGRIRSATQGYFEITARDGESEGYGVSDTPDKRVRVVTTVEYSLD